MTLTSDIGVRTTLRYECLVDPGPTAIRLLRSHVRSMLRDRSCPAQAIEAVLLSLDEVLMNAVENTPEAALKDGLGVVLELGAHGIEVEVLDRGESAQLAGLDAELPDFDAENGRGMFLIRELMDEVSFFAREGGGTRVRLVKRF